jgi:hypothetical protein
MRSFTQVFNLQSEINNLKLSSYPVLCNPAAMPLMVAPRG